MNKAPAPRKKSKGRSGTKSQLDYCQQMHRIFMAQQADPIRKFMTVEELAVECELDKSTVTRYLAFMRDRLHLPVGPVRSRGGQGYTKRVYHFPLHTFTEGDMFLFVVAKGALGKGTPFADKFPPLCAKVERALQSDEVDLNKLESIVHFHDAGMDARAFIDPELWDFFAHACMENREVQFDYLKAELDAVPSHRVIKPLALHEIGRTWYVWCPDDDRPGEFKKFALNRMSHVEHTGATFQPIEFDPAAYLNSIGAFTGGPAEPVHLHIRGKSARLVRERDIHPSQRITERPDGTIDVHLELAITPEVENWINLRAGDVEVIAPLTLRATIHRLLSAGAELNRPL